MSEIDTCYQDVHEVATPLLIDKMMRSRLNSEGFMVANPEAAKAQHEDYKSLRRELEARAELSDTLRAHGGLGALVHDMMVLTNSVELENMSLHWYTDNGMIEFLWRFDGAGIAELTVDDDDFLKGDWSDYVINFDKNRKTEDLTSRDGLGLGTTAAQEWMRERLEYRKSESEKWLSERRKAEVVLENARSVFRRHYGEKYAAMTGQGEYAEELREDMRRAGAVTVDIGAQADSSGFNAEFDSSIDTLARLVQTRLQNWEEAKPGFVDTYEETMKVLNVLTPAVNAIGVLAQSHHLYAVGKSGE